MKEIRATLEALHYLIDKQSKNVGLASVMAVLKLFFFAQRYHLRKYGRLIAKDKFVAMKHGPVASLAFDIMKGNLKAIKNSDDKKYINEILELIPKWYIKIKKDIEYDELSESDIEALDFALDNFGDLDQWQLVDETHKYAEWKKHEAEISENRKSVNMNILDFFGESPKNSPFDIIPQEQTKINKEMFLGEF